MSRKAHQMNRIDHTCASVLSVFSRKCFRVFMSEWNRLGRRSGRDTIYDGEKILAVNRRKTLSLEKIRFDKSCRHEKRMKIVCLSFVYIFLLSSGVSSFACSPLARDSLSQKSLMLHFRFDRSLLERDYMDNELVLARLDSLLSESLRVSLADTIIIVSYASPEGNVDHNLRLARSRAVAVKGYLVWKYSHVDQHRILIRPQGENWTGLRHLVEADKAVPAREKVLALLDEENDTEQLKILLRHLNGGKTYRYISGRLLPVLRNAAVCTIVWKACGRDSSLGPADEKQSISPMDDVSLNALDTIVRVSELPRVGERGKDLFPVIPDRPLFALKTNILTWVGLLPTGKFAAFRPNLAVEFFFARRWSFTVGGEYSCWKGGQDGEFWGISGYSIEPRFWLIGDGRYRWVYAGIYGQSGDFDHQLPPSGDFSMAGDSSTGSYWSAGVSLGVYLPLGKHFGLETGIRAGYRDASVKAYDNETGGCYYNHDFSSSRRGITGLNFSLEYRWGTKIKK